MQIEVYESEVKDGIGEMVAKGSMSFASMISKPKNDKTQEELAFALSLCKASANPNQRDLLYKHSVLASVGWNKNDDVFDKFETFKAIHTVSDKQLNLRHNELDIVGHMTDSYAVCVDGNIISTKALEENSLPDKFDIVSEFVLYKIWENQERQEEINRIIAEIDEGKWFVSMECRFPAFDYAVIDKDGLHKTISRNDKTAFLTKHLKMYGGTGEYQGNKIGRLLKGLFFTGQGIVENPANERSIIFNVEDIKPFNSKGSLIIKDVQMELEKQVSELKEKLNSAQADINKLASEKISLSEAAKMADEKAKTDMDKMKDEKTKYEEIISDKDKLIASLTEEVKTANEKFSVAKQEIEAAKAEDKKKTRANKLSLAGVVETELEATLAKWENLSDEQFDSIVAFLPPWLDKDKKKEKDDKNEDSETKKTEDKEKAKSADFTKAELEVEKVVNQPIEKETNTRMSALAKHLGENLQFSAKANKLNK